MAACNGSAAGQPQGNPHPWSNSLRRFHNPRLWPPGLAYIFMYVFIQRHKLPHAFPWIHTEKCKRRATMAKNAQWKLGATRAAAGRPSGVHHLRITPPLQHAAAVSPAAGCWTAPPAFVCAPGQQKPQHPAQKHRQLGPTFLTNACCTSQE